MCMHVERVTTSDSTGKSDITISVMLPEDARVLAQEANSEMAYLCKLSHVCFIGSARASDFVADATLADIFPNKQLSVRMLH